MKRKKSIKLKKINLKNNKKKWTLIELLKLNQKQDNNKKDIKKWKNLWAKN
jgi:hypothetical protein